MQGKIAVEEHFAIAQTLADSADFFRPTIWSELKFRLLDLQERRLQLMDQHGIEVMVLSLNAPAIQSIRDPVQAREAAWRANDFLAGEVVKRPSRFQAFASLPMQDPDFASLELERCVRELNFKGALVNGFSEASGSDSPLYYDLLQYRPFWSVVQRLNVPFYLHPRNPPLAGAEVYEGHSWLLGPTWAFGQETAVHALRLMGSGLFDVYPGLNIILGHLGEGLPYSMWRIDNRCRWMNIEPEHRAKGKISDCFRSHFYLTTSGNFRTQSLIDAILEIGSDRILFATDWPFENIDHAADWFDNASISENDRLKIGRLNAIRLLAPHEAGAPSGALT
jgi:gamma-resorcylate decarboxylase